MVAGEGDEVVGAGGLVTLQAGGHDAFFVSEQRQGWPIHRVLCDEWGSGGACGALG